MAIGTVVAIRWDSMALTEAGLRFPGIKVGWIKLVAATIALNVAWCYCSLWLPVAGDSRLDVLTLPEQ
jgi:hypothetical protein